MSADRAFPAGAIRWILGIEDTCVIPPPGSTMSPLDEFDLTDHTLWWREDLATARGLGADAVRYGVRWPKVHTAPGVFDWSELDERLSYAVHDLGLVVIADLVHYGTPTWLPDSFADLGYPDAIAEFAAAFATRYRGLVDHLTPLNEPVTTASFCGLRGVWPPARTGWAGWTAVVLGIIEGERRSIVALRAANPDAVVVHVEAATLYTAGSPDLEAHADLLRATAALPTDLLLGRVDEQHPLHGWLITQGADPGTLRGFLDAVPVIDLLGVNYYPNLTPRTLLHLNGGVEQRTTDRWTDGLERCLRWFADRYRLPMLLTETSIEGDDVVRERWALESASTLTHLHEEGMDVRGYTWWPLTDFVDWSWASGGRNVEEFLLDDPSPTSSAAQRFSDLTAGRTTFLRRMGLLHLEAASNGDLHRVPTAAARAFRTAASRVAAEVSSAG